MLDALVEKTYDILKDFRKDDGVQITREGIREWAEQFGEDAEFMLSETNHILQQTYLTKDTAIELLRSYIKDHLKRYRYPDVVSYLKDVCFFRLQPAGKSQNVLVDMVEEIIHDDYGLKVADFWDYPKKLFIYFDDMLVTGGTIERDLARWINEGNRITELNNRTINLEVDLIVEHRFGQKMMPYRLGRRTGQDLNTDNIHIWHYYEIENHLKLYSGYGIQHLNAVAIPVREYLSHEAIEYWENLNADRYPEYAFRSENMPATEEFFTSAENRIRYEQILVDKGLYIIGQIRGEIGGNIRPLGFINPSYKTLGVGTLFFTWRNVPNNSPLVFWWDVPGHNWKPLFPARRG